MTLRTLESGWGKTESNSNGEINYSNVIGPIVIEKYTKLNGKRENNMSSSLGNSWKVSFSLQVES